jgi:hypothetical protein
MAFGRRCDMGCESWPDDDKYETCPICGQEAERFSNLDPLTETEAAHALFEHFYAKWDEDHDPARLEGDAPDARGKYASSSGCVEDAAEASPRAST